MPHPRGPPGIGIDLLHIPRLLKVIYPSAHARARAYGHAYRPEISVDPDLRSVKKFARRILSLEELAAFERRFLEANTWEKRGRWKEEMGRWLGVRWAAKEALYKAYPYPWPLKCGSSVGVGIGIGVEGHEEGEKGKGGEEGLGERLTWKEVTMRVDGISGEFGLPVLSVPLKGLWVLRRMLGLNG
ncbi:hypothetical protein EV426DRAFT_588966 [Tirmania nivea]|nr:hypothetical protein EV426DRAFT_588966 [Tirmania nivea]